MTKNPTPKKERGLKENVIEHQILTWLMYNKIFAWKNVTGGYFDVKLGRHKKQRSKFAINGVSDIVGIYKGRPLFIECKADKGRLTENQKWFLTEARKHGAIAIVARSIGDVETELNKLEGA